MLLSIFWWHATPGFAFTGKIGIIGRLSTNDGSDLGPFWRLISGYMMLAVEHVNTRNNSLVPSATLLPPDFHLEYRYFDSRSNPSRGVTIAVELSAWGAHAVIGAVRSAVSAPVALVAGTAQTPVISYASTSQELADAVRNVCVPSACPPAARVSDAAVVAC